MKPTQEPLALKCALLPMVGIITALEIGAMLRSPDGNCALRELSFSMNRAGSVSYTHLTLPTKA